VKYAVVYERTPRNWSAYVPDLPGCIAAGATRTEVERLIEEGSACIWTSCARGESRSPSQLQALDWSTSPSGPRLQTAMRLTPGATEGLRMS
jgi:predicted RNase H-like HicB family nuclease